MPISLAVVELSQIVQVIWVSILASVCATALFSVVVLGAARSADARRSGRGGAAMVFATLAVLCFVAFAGGVIYGVQVMLSKG
jgi:hypothetical protein